MTRRQTVMLAGALVGLVMTGCAQKRSCTIVCVGDSLTACGGEGGKYTDWLAKWLPQHTIVNKGVGGDTLAGGRTRFQRDVIDLNPDIVVIELGANDFWAKSRPIEDLQADLEDMVARCRKIGAQVVIASCFGGRQYGRETKIEFEKDRVDYAQAIADMEDRVVRKYGCLYVPNMQVDIKPNGKPLYWDDTNHPNKAGNEFVARRILAELRKALRART